jgi:hypothetical protein
LDTSAFSAGDTLWLSETAGAWQANTPPAEPAHAVFLGYVARSHPNLGRVVIQVQNGYELNELHGVQISSEANNETILFESSTGLWKNKPISASVISDSTSVGQNLMKLTNPSAISFIRINADNQVVTRTPSQVLTDLGISSNIILNRNFADTTALTGTTANTLIYSVLIPANTLQANDWINLKTFVRASTAGANVNVYLNTSPTIPVSSIVTIGQLTLAANIGGLFERNFMITSIGSTGSIKYFGGSALSAYTPANNTASSATINTTIEQYIVFASQNSLTTTSFITNGTLITLSR